GVSVTVATSGTCRLYRPAPTPPTPLGDPGGPRTARLDGASGSPRTLPSAAGHRARAAQAAAGGQHLGDLPAGARERRELRAHRTRGGHPEHRLRSQGETGHEAVRLAGPRGGRGGG